MAKQQENRKYGLFSLLALIVGVVIGSGIFVKNESVINTAGSTTNALISWGIVSFLIILMVFAFVEIASSTKLSKKPGTMSHWMGTFVGPKSGKMIGIFMLYVYFPIIIFALSMWGAEKVLQTSSEVFNPMIYDQAYEMVVFNEGYNEWALYGGTIALGLVFMLIAYYINIASAKGSKMVGNTGLALKTIPLFTVIIMAFVALGTGAGTLPTGAPIEGANEPTFSAIILALPPIMFAFDGFVYSASMQNEAKTDKTFMTAWVGGMIFVIAIYIMYSFSIMVVVGDEGSFTLVGAIREWLPDDVETWMIPLMETIVIISILSGLNGQIISANKSMASLSAENVTPDYRGTYIRLNGQGRPQFAAYKELFVSLMWMLGLVTLDAINMATGGALTTGSYTINDVVYEYEYIYHMSATNYASDITAVVSFTAYAAIMLGGVWNRKVNKVEVEKKSYFIPTAVIASLGLLFISGFQAYNIFYTLFTEADWMPFVVMVAMLGVPAGLYFWFNRTIKNNPVTRRREAALKRFWNAETDPIFKDHADTFMFTYPKDGKPRKAHDYVPKWEKYAGKLGLYSR